MKYVLPLLLFGALHYPLQPVSGQDASTLRKTYWGMSRAEVLTSELPRKGLVSKVEPNVVAFTNVSFGEVKVRLIYAFTHDALDRAQYYYRPASTKEWAAISVYLEIKDGLSAKYGDPLEEESSLLTELTKKAPAHSTQISLLDSDPVKYYHAWETPSTVIVLSYWDPEDPAQGEPLMKLDYFSKSTKKKEHASKKVSPSDL